MWLRLLISIGIALSALVAASESSAQVAGDCGLIRAQLFGNGPSDMHSASYKYSNYKGALANTEYRLRQDEEDLEAARNAQSAYFLAHGKTDATLEFRLESVTYFLAPRLGLYTHHRAAVLRWSCSTSLMIASVLSVHSSMHDIFIVQLLWLLNPTSLTLEE